MGKKFIVVLVCLWAGIGNAREDSVWKRFVKTGLVEYKNFEEIDFDEVAQEDLNLPSSFEKIRKQFVNFPVRNGKSREDEFEFKLLQEIQNREISDLSVLKKLTIKQMLELAIDITQRSMFYQYVRTSEPIGGYSNIDSVDCFLEGCGVCADYANNFARIFYWLKNYNPKLKNLWVLYTYGDTYEPASEKKADDLLENGLSSTHAWNIIVYFTNEKMIYSHIDMTGAENKYGQMQEGKVGYHLSENENVNLAKLLESLGESNESLNLLQHEYKLQAKKQKLLAVDKIRRLNHLVQVSTQTNHDDISCNYYRQLAKLVRDRSQIKKNVKSYCGTLF